MSLFNVTYRTASGSSESRVKTGVTTVRAPSPHAARMTAHRELSDYLQIERYPRIRLEILEVEEITEEAGEAGDAS